MKYDDYIKLIQMFINMAALLAGGFIYKAYVESLKESLRAKDEQTKTALMNLNFWKDKATDLEKKTPEFVEKILNDRIKVREEEIIRLSEDKELHVEAIVIQKQELLRLNSELEKAKDVSKQALLINEYFDDELLDRSELEIELIGSVGVDSGQLMITDPCYIESEWKKKDFEDIRLYKDYHTSQVYQYLKDFNQYNEIISGYDKNVNELIEDGTLVELELKIDFDYSYKGVCAASMSEEGYGELNYEAGHKGAGIAFRTLLGDGEYNVYAEKYNGAVIRVYVDLI